MAGGPVIGVLSPFVGGAYYGLLLAGLGASAALRGSRVIAIQTLDAAADMTVNSGNPAFGAPVSWDHISGFVVLADAVTNSYLRRIEATGRPVVLLGHETGSIACPAVLADNGSGIREAVTHLIAHGHRRIAFTGYPSATDVAERFQAYQQALLAHGITPDPALFLRAADNLESGITWTAADLTRSGEAPSAIVAGTDRNAIGVLRRLSAAGLQCPRDFALTGFDDMAAAPYLEPGLASVRQMLDTMADTAVDLLLRMLAGEQVPPGPHRVPTVFVPRGSCGCTDVALILQPAAEPAGRRRLAERLSDLLPPVGVRSGGRTAEDLDLVRHAVVAVAAAVAAATRDELPDHDAAAGALLALYALQPQPESPRMVSRAVQEYTRELETADVAAVRRIDDCVQELILVLARAHGRGQFAEQWRLRSTISVHYAVSMALLYNRDTNPRDLAWLAITPASAASVALWGAGGELELSPGWRRDAGPAIPGGSTTISAFPPAELIAVAQPHEVVFVVPAKVRTSDRGWLAVVDVVESGVEDGRELVNQCAALLTVAIDLREQEERLRRAALSDPLTGLPNRAAFVETLDAAVLDEQHFAVLFLDLDGFKHVNDTHGHAAGDQLLVHVADRIRHNLRPGDVAARYGGDEFVVLVGGTPGPARLTDIIDRLRDAIIAPFHLAGLAGTAVHIGVSIGSALSEHHRSAAEILLDADAAMYRAKARPRLPSHSG
jgi:diguanylate cyclase (GGDEF)-like protein